MMAASNSSIVSSIQKFVASKDDPNSVLFKCMNVSPDHKEPLVAQMETFEADIKKLTEGKMSYAEMRSLYG